VPAPLATVGAVAARPVAVRPAALVRPAPAADPADAPPAAFARRFGVPRGDAARAGGGSAAEVSRSVWRLSGGEDALENVLDDGGHGVSATASERMFE
jgi:hypothetical protein